MIPLRLFAAASVAALVLSCAVGPAPRPENAAPAPAERAARKRPAIPAERPGAELSGPAFTRMDPRALDYLKALAAEASKGNAEYLLSLGEVDYRNRTRPRVDDPYYFALLFRIGPYSEEKPSDSDKPIREDPARLRGIKYTGWTDRGPIAEVRARMRFSDGRELPCALFVLWKLEEPRILGRDL